MGTFHYIFRDSLHFVDMVPIFLICFAYLYFYFVDIVVYLFI